MATKILLLGKLIYAAITSDTGLAAKVGTKVFPIVAPAETTYPFVVYTRSNAGSNIHTKDAWMGDAGSFQITVVDDNYNDAVTIAEDIRQLLEDHVIYNNELKLFNIRMVSSSENFSDDTFTETLYFECEAE